MSILKTVVFDIETGPLPDETIEAIADPFKESSVKTGNLGLDKSLEKIQLRRFSKCQMLNDIFSLLL